MQRLLGVALGAAVTFLILLVGAPAKDGGVTTYAVGAIVGAIVSFAWPVLIGFYSSRREQDKATQKFDDRVSAEVQRQLADERARREK